MEDFIANYVYAQGKGKKTIVLFKNIADAMRAYSKGFRFKKLNIGNIHHEDYKVCCAPSVFLCEPEIQDVLKLLEENGVAVELKRVPREKAVNIKDVLKEFCPVEQ